MTHTPTGGYVPADPAQTPADPYAAPAESYTGLNDPYAAPAPVYDETVSYDEPSKVGQAKDVAKDEAANVKNVAKDEAANVKDTTLGEAANVKDTTVQAGQQVAGVAKEEVKNVAAETGKQAKELAQQAMGELSSQAGQQKQQLAGLIHSYADELKSMASSTDGSGPLSNLVHQASSKASEVGQWLEDREPAEVLDDVRSFARRRPVAFLVGAATAGVLIGRFTRGLAADAKDNKEQAQLASTSRTGLTTGYAPQRTSMAGELPAQGGRYGDLASEEQVVGYDAPAGTTAGTAYGTGYDTGYEGGTR